MTLLRSVLTLVIAALVVIGAASAQDYSVRVMNNTNLRAAASLQARIVETAPAGSTLLVVGSEGRWLRIDRNGNPVWMAAWVSYSRVQSAQQPTAPPQTPIDNCCFVDRQCNTDEEWRNGYYAFQNGQCAAPAQSQLSAGPVAAVSEPLIIGAPATTQINNCCNLDRECHTEEDWDAGWLAYRDNECVWELVNYKPAGSQPLLGIDNCCHAPGWFCQSDENFRKGQLAYQANNHCPTHLISTFMFYELYPTTDNCCHLGRECHSDADWQRGYSDFLHFRCAIDVPLITNLPISIEGNQDFIALWRAALSLLKAQSPRFYDYAITGLNAIKEYSDGDPNKSGCYVSCGSEKTAYCEWIHPFTYIDHELIAVTASVIVHEACHCHRDEKGYPHGNNFWETELPCVKAQADLMKDLDPGNSFGIPWEDYRESARIHNVTDLRY